MRIGLMIEGQDDLNWARWQRILQAAESLGFDSVFRSDHFTNSHGPNLDSLECWTALTYAASATQRIEFGSLVSPITFRHPSILVRLAAAVSDLSGGRLVFGVGAGWQEREHRAFGIPFYDFPTRYAMLNDGLEIMLRLLRSDDPVTYGGKHFSVEDAILLPRPRQRVPILIGGNGSTRTLPLAARYADEWNGVFISADTFKEKNELLTKLCEGIARDPKEIKRSVMTQVVYLRDDAELQAAVEEAGDATALRSGGRIIAGTAPQVIEQLQEYAAAGCQRIMLQWLDLDDIERLEDMARAILPAFHRADA